MNILVIALVAAAIIIILYVIGREKKADIISRAKSHGILINGEHYKVYKVYRSTSYTDGGVYKTHHNVHDFGELMLVSSKKDKVFITERHLQYCLKIRKHSARRKENGEWTNKWSEWSIDPNGWDEKGLSKNEVYLSLN